MVKVLKGEGLLPEEQGDEEGRRTTTPESDSSTKGVESDEPEEEKGNCAHYLRHLEYLLDKQIDWRHDDIITPQVQKHKDQAPQQPSVIPTSGSLGEAPCLFPLFTGVQHLTQVNVSDPSSDSSNPGTQPTRIVEYEFSEQEEAELRSRIAQVVVQKGCPFLHYAVPAGSLQEKWNKRLLSLPYMPSKTKIKKMKRIEKANRLVAAASSGPSHGAVEIEVEDVQIPSSFPDSVTPLKEKRNKRPGSLQRQLKKRQIASLLASKKPARRSRQPF